MLNYNKYIVESKRVGLENISINELISHIYNGNSNKVRQYISSGFDINKKSELGELPLHVACKSSMLMIVKILLENGYNVDMFNVFYDNRTALYYASTNKILDLVLDYGANVNFTDIKGQTPIMFRYNMNRFFSDEKYTLEKMLNKGLNLDIKDNDGNNLYDILKKKSQNIEIIEYIDQNFPKYKYEWELKQNINNYNI